MAPIEINVRLTRADRDAYLAAWMQRLQSRAAARNPVSWLTRYLQRPAASDAASVLLGPCTMRFDATGVLVRSGKSNTLHEWSAIQDGSATAHHLFLWGERLSALIVPIRDLPAGMAVVELQQRLEAAWTAAAHSSSSTVLAPHQPAARTVAA